MASKDAEHMQFASRKWVWVPDQKIAFIKGFVVEEQDDGKLRIRCTDDSVRLQYRF